MNDNKTMKQIMEAAEAHKLEIVSKLVSLKYVGLCPRCLGDLHVYPEGRILYECRRCGLKGDSVFPLMEMVYGTTFSENARRIAIQYGINLKEGGES